MINGSQNPIVGKDEYYTLTDFSLGLAFLDVNPKYSWRINRKYNGAWKDITKQPQKTGISAPFKFGPQVVGEMFLLEVYKETKNILTQRNETHKMGEITVIPASSKVPKITKVVLFNRGARDVNKASYTDRLIARAYCVGMFGKTINFHLWEDDASGGGHNAKINKNNRHNKDYPARVNIDGIAEAEISLAADKNVLKQIANRFRMTGDSSEGAFHEFYVTASYEGKILKANQTNVEVVNPDYKKEAPRPQRIPTRTSQPVPAKKNEDISLVEKSINFVVDAVIGAFEKPEKTKTASSVGRSQTQQKTICLCKETQLYWGTNFTCADRKKIIEISRRLMCDPNHLTSAMALETGGTFDPSIVNSLGYTGLIQIGSTAAADINRRKGTTVTAGKSGNLKNMSKFDQLTYVEYYLEPFKGKLNTLADFYLAILMPVDCGKGHDRNHVVFDKNLTLDYKNGKVIKNTKWVRQRAYEQNPVFHKEGKNEKGQTFVWEIADEIQKWYDKGNKNLANDFKCQETTKQENNEEENSKWHDPVDNPQLCLYTQMGNYRPRYNVFGKVRRERENPKHQGIDFLALPDSNVYACVDAYIEFIEVQKGYGNVICLKVKNKEDFLKRKRNFSLQYASEGEILEGSGFNYNGDFYLFYAHLKKINISKSKKEVKCGDIIAQNGTSGYGSTKDPHLHFEIRNNARASGLNNRCHPGIFVNYKGENDMSQTEKDYHKKIAEKNWD